MRTLAGQFGVTLLATLLCSGCVATKYQLARHGTPPAQVIDHPFPASGGLEVHLVGLITYHGPGSWKREALWDEYVVTLANASDRPITVESAALTDSAGRIVAPGTDPWELEKQTKTLEAQYRSRGEAFIRVAGPGVLLLGTGAAAAAAAASGGWYLIAPAVGGAMVTAVFVLPVYYTTVVAIDYHNKHQILDEFRRRRLAAPLVLSPGETRTASLFFPMVRSPTALGLNWRSEGDQVTAALPLEFLRDLHVPAASGARPSMGPDSAARARP